VGGLKQKENTTKSNLLPNR